ncbi:RecQ family zinc-binding domain-containing protein [Nitrospira sp. BLG_2]|uniref:RecQ family zinc-binding domain-containing protein n=1 Tax=Nitrospira sp. BLG_2 TaxID=3397507 RepID=UPI003B9D4870
MDEFGRYLAEYEGRYQSDRDKLQSMMKYGQTMECRVRFLMRYFGNESRGLRPLRQLPGSTHGVVDVREWQTGSAIGV